MDTHFMLATVNCLKEGPNADGDEEAREESPTGGASVFVGLYLADGGHRERLGGWFRHGGR